MSAGSLGSLYIYIKVSNACPSNLHYRGYAFTFEYCIFPKYPFTAPRVFLRQFDQQNTSKPCLPSHLPSPHFVNPHSWEIKGLPILDAKEWNPIMSLSSIIIALELLVTHSSTSEEVAISRQQEASSKWTCGPKENKGGFVDTKKRKYAFITKERGDLSNDASSEQSDNEALHLGMNPIKRLRKQMDQLKVVSPPRAFVNSSFNQHSGSTGLSTDQESIQIVSAQGVGSCQPFLGINPQKEVQELEEDLGQRMSVE
ncbi:hypothetical protein FGO68_gene10161 [Halteria grandinella]|uniref:Uncharacterized protein n=1 Tax=Halteria grandinella TaxID=5974 RepID=A0A8J8T1F1_HALGN|nr:hypothetical protein FGO68_gene10161 [Halteria grandinella]